MAGRCVLHPRAIPCRNISFSTRRAICPATRPTSASVGQSQYPLAGWNFGQYAINQMRGGIGHAAVHHPH